jgi:tetratricopeptide (TPR) repeat protein
MMVLAALTAIAIVFPFVSPLSRPATTRVALGPGGRPAIAVMTFDNAAGGDMAWLSAGVPSMLVTGLAQTHGLDIITAQRLHEAAEQAGYDDLTTLDRRQMADVARRAGAGAIVTGRIFRSSSDVRIDAQVEDLSSGLVLAGESVRGTDVFALVDQLAARVRNSIGFSDARNVRQIADVSTTSVHAYRLYSEGMNAFSNVRLDEAQKLLEQAVSLDSTFAEAHLRLALLGGLIGRPDITRDTLRRAAEHADRLSERNRLLLDTLAARTRGESMVASRLLDDLIERFPDVEDAYVMAHNLYDPINGPLPDAEKLLSIARAGATVLPNSAEMRNIYGYALISAGRYPDAIKEFEAYARLAPREPNPFDSLGDAYLMLGSPEKAAESYGRAVAIDPGYPSNSGRAYALAMLGRYEEAIALQAPLANVRAILLSRIGRYREAEAALAAAIKGEEANGNVANAAAYDVTLALLALERRDSGRALRHTRAAADRLRDDRARAQPVGMWAANATAFAGFAEVAAGRLEQARSRLAQAGKSDPAGSWLDRALEGEIALAAGDLTGAASAFAAAAPAQRTFGVYGPHVVVRNNIVLRDGLARVARARGDLAGAIQIYRRLLEYGPDQKWVSVFEPRYVLEIAKLLDKAGDRPAARREYERFLDLWKGADAGLPELAEARRGLARP